MKSYKVRITMEGGRWLAVAVDVPGAQTWGRSVATVVRGIAEAIALCEGIPDESIDAVMQNLECRLSGDAWRTVEAAKAARKRAEAEAAKALLASQTAAVTLTELGLSLRDAATLLRVSHQQVKLLLGAAPRAATPASARAPRAPRATARPGR